METLGLVLAVLPLFIEGAKQYSKGVDTITKVVSRTLRDKRLLEFYKDFWWELFVLNVNVRKVVNSLPDLSDERKADIEIEGGISDWHNSSDIVRAVREYFGTEERYNAFLVVMDQIVQLLSQLVKDSTIQISKRETNQKQMFEKLREFSHKYENQPASSTMFERIKFWRKEKDRNTCLRALKTWNSRLEKLASESDNVSACVRRPTAIPVAPQKDVWIYNLSSKLHSALARVWACDCRTPHEARVSLNNQEIPSNKAVEEVDIRFDFIFLVHASETRQSSLQEGEVKIRVHTDSMGEDREEVTSMCQVFRRAHKAGNIRLQLSVAYKDEADNLQLWQHRSRPKQLSFDGKTPAVSLKSVMLNGTLKSLLAKRKLALMLAKSLLQLSARPWLTETWNKEHITFFHESFGVLAVTKPYLSSVFRVGQEDGSDQLDINQLHPCPSILSLGILLIEIDTMKTIESFRTSDDLTDGVEVNANTDWTTANRVVQSLENCSMPYRETVQACLDTPWVSAGQRVSLENASTRNGFIRDVVQPLQQELEYLSRARM